jgi:hypothetical protein
LGVIQSTCASTQSLLGAGHGTENRREVDRHWSLRCSGSVTERAATLDDVKVEVLWDLMGCQDAKPGLVEQGP